MTAISVVPQGHGVGRDPVTEITGRIERSRTRLKRERAAGLPSLPAESGYPVFDGGSFVGAVYATAGRPAFGPAAPAVLLRREP
jgi:hypothetical protein